LGGRASAAAFSSGGVATASDDRPAFYALAAGGRRDYVTLLHLPYTAWHLSYVVVGGCLAASVAWGRLGLTVLAFGLAMGIGAHALDELHGRPLGTTIPGSVLVSLAVASVALACAIGVAVALETTLWLLPLVAAGAFLVPAYNLELFGGRLHTDLGFALTWGAFPVVTAYVAQAETLHLEAALAAAWATALSLAQRRLSTEARRARRGAAAPALEREPDVAAEAVLKLLTGATVALAATLLALRL
jgi:hypothetical protein